MKIEYHKNDKGQYCILLEDIEGDRVLLCHSTSKSKAYKKAAKSLKALSVLSKLASLDAQNIPGLEE